MAKKIIISSEKGFEESPQKKGKFDSEKLKDIIIDYLFILFIAIFFAFIVLIIGIISWKMFLIIFVIIIVSIPLFCVINIWLLSKREKRK